MIALLFIFLLVGVPVGIAFSLAILVQADKWNVSLEFVAQTTLDALLNYPFLAIPLFILSGELMSRGGITRQLVRFSTRLFGWSQAAMGHVMILASAIMGAITGSSVAAVAAIGRAIGPEMLKRGYQPGYVGALNASAGLLGVLLPPSIPLILYGSAVGVSITTLFLATLVPGLMFAAAFMIVHALRARHVLQGGVELAVDASAESASAGGNGRFGLVAALFMPILVLGGIYSGVLTPTEAASVAALYALFYAILNRSVRMMELGDAFVKAAASGAAIMFIIGFTTVFNRGLVLQQIPQQIAALSTSYIDSPLVFLLVANLVLLLVGMFMETSAATLLMGPLLAPAAVQYGIDPIHFGIILVINIEIGLLTPPLAANLYVAALVNKIPLIPLIRQLAWFLGACLVCLALVTYVPEIALWYEFLPWKP
ncbi:TRAP transporter large permease [Aromatoleum evansii]|uniref:TRAP transporter large permease protein n=1 Tax=Aromatoleum evansii TaxID=59406 RepID=A0ABZ1AJY5_AROEV|nr:TRAP transporter large permease [Aromatoleum evansii]NMG29802.1 TRAP transporter large permease subunit [Aromatoleum evansii]WRL44872.1 TRAP transporter large permease [Aromatoleum evansii]